MKINDLSNIPGYSKLDPNGDFFYIEYRDRASFNKVYTTIVDSCYELVNGGSFNDESTLITPDGKKFHAVCCRGDLDAWEKGILRWSKERLLKVGIIRGSDLLIFGDGQYSLLDCELDTDWR